MVIYGIIHKKAIIVMKGVVKHAFSGGYSMGYIFEKKYECISESKIQEIQSERLKKQVICAYEKLPFYRDRMNKMGVTPHDIKTINDIVKLPFMERKDLIENYPYGTLVIPTRNIARVQGTSGTSGNLLFAAYSQNDISIWAKCMGRCLAMAGITSNDTLQICHGYGLFTGGIGVDYGANLIGATVIPMSTGDTKRQIMALKDLNVTAIACTPSYALTIGEALENNNLRSKIKLRVGVMGAEPWTKQLQKKIEQSLNIECFDLYGMCEVLGPGIAMECETHSGLHIHHDHFFPEIVNPLTGTTLPDSTYGELVISTLTKEAMPLLRYKTHDITSIEHLPCSCGRTSPRISKLVGRTDDMRVVRGVNVYPSQIETILLNVPGVIAGNYLLVIEKNGYVDKLTIQVEVDEKTYEHLDLQEKTKNNIYWAAKESIGLKVMVELLAPHTFRRSDGKTSHMVDKRIMS